MYALLAIAVAPALVAAAETAPTTDLDRLPRWLPYRAYRGLIETIPPLERMALMHDATDSSDVIVWPGQATLRTHRWVGEYPVVSWETRVPPAFAYPAIEGPLRQVTVGLLAACSDATDTHQSLFVLAQSADGRQNELWRLDPADGRFEARFPLPQGPDNNGDGVWDGRYGFLGVVDDARASSGRALIVVCNVAYDAAGRGIRALDPADGRVLWFHETGVAQYHDNRRTGSGVHDLEGDGRPEIVVLGWAPDNLHGATINGTSDDRCWLIVLDSSGKLLWRRSCGGPFANARVAVADLTGDRRREVVCATQWTQKPDSNEIVVWSARGDRLAHEKVRTPLLGLAALRDSSRHASDIVVGGVDGRLIRYRLSGDSLEPVARAACSGRLSLHGALDILPSPGPELVATSPGKGTFILDGNLRPLAHSALPEFSAPSSALAWRISASESMLLINGGNDCALRFVPARPSLALNIVALVAALVGVGAGTLAWPAIRRIIRDSARVPRASAELRKRRLSLSHQLERLDHEPVGQLLKLAQRMRVLVESGMAAVALDSPRAAYDPPPAQLSKLRAASLAWLHQGPSKVANTLALARRCGAEEETVKRAEQAIAGAQAVLMKLADPSSDFRDIARHLPELEEHAKEAELLHKRLLGWVGAEFSTRVVDVVKGILDSHESTIRQHDVVVIAPEQSDAVARIAEADFRFVIDNLVENALRAMQRGDVRRLDISLRAENQRIEIEVADTGCGIPPEHQDRLMQARFSTRGAGGGLGLYRSRSLLAEYGGTIDLLKSVPGEGTTFRVVLPQTISRL